MLRRLQHRSVCARLSQLPQQHRRLGVATHQRRFCSTGTSGSGSGGVTEPRINLVQRVWQLAGAATAMTVAVGCGVILLWPLFDAFGIPFVYQTAIHRSNNIEYLSDEDEVDGNDSTARDAYFVASAIGNCLRGVRRTTSHGDVNTAQGNVKLSDGKGKVIVVTCQHGSHKSDMLKHLHHTLRFGSYTATTTSANSGSSSQGQQQQQEQEKEKEHERRIVYVNCKSYVDSGTFLYGTLNGVLGPSLGSLGFIAIAYHKLFNAAIDFITLNQNHVHVSYTIFNQTLGHMHKALLWIQTERKHDIFLRAREISSASSSWIPGKRTDKPVKAKPVFVVDGLETLVSLQRGNGDSGGGDFALFPQLLCASLLRWATDEGLCDVVFLGDVSVLQQQEQHRQASSSVKPPTLWSTKLANAFPELTRAAQHTTLSGAVHADTTQQQLTSRVLDLCNATSNHPLLILATLKDLAHYSVVSASQLTQRFGVSAETAEAALRSIRESGFGTVSVRPAASNSLLLQHGATNPELSTQSLFQQQQAVHETTPSNATLTLTATLQPVLAGNINECFNGGGKAAECLSQLLGALPVSKSPVVQLVQVPFPTSASMSLDALQEFLAKHVSAQYGNGIAVREPGTSSSPPSQWSVLTDDRDVLSLSNGSVVSPTVGQATAKKRSMSKFPMACTVVQQQSKADDGGDGNKKNGEGRGSGSFSVVGWVFKVLIEATLTAFVLQQLNARQS